jgi:ABC-type transport system substrate-binding protein
MGSPAPEGTLVYALDGQITQLTNANSDVPTAEAVGWLYSAIYRYNESLIPVPDLASEEATISEDGLTWTVTLVDNATFQPTGTNLTAEDVVFSYEMANSANCRFNPSICLAFVTVDADNDPETESVPVLESVTALDERTVEFVLADKYAPFATTILPGIAIDSKEATEASFQRLNEASGQITEEEVTALKERIDADAALEIDEEADPENPATSANPIQFRAELEALLGRVSGLEVPAADAVLYPAVGEDGLPTGELDEAAYVGALITVFNDLATSREAEGVDAIAAAYPILDVSREPVGSGPFYVTAFNAGENIEAAANQEYHHGAPALESLFMPIITEDLAGAQALIAGQIDWKYSMTAESFNQVQGQENLKVAEYPDFGYFGLQFNLREGKLFADKNLRQALEMCVQKAEIVAAATLDQGITIYADIPPASWAYNQDLPILAHDPAAGMALIEESGWTKGADGVYEKDGQRLATEVLVRAGKPDRIAYMQLLSDQANQNCGFDMTIKEVDFGTVLVPMLSWPHAQQGKAGSSVLDKQFDAYFGGWSSGFDPDPYAIYHSSQCTTPEQADTYNYICFQNEEADKLIERGLKELDQEARAEIYQDFEAILAEELPYMFAWSDIAREGLNAGLNYTDAEWTPETMATPTWFWQLEKITKTAQ